MVDPLTSGLAVKGFVQLVSSVTTSLSSSLKRLIKEWNTEAKISELFRKIKKIDSVKTIWQIDKPMNIDAFFVAPHILLDEKRKKVIDFGSFENNPAILLEGIAGQGKSILMRWITIQELKRGIKIPIFFELRRIKKDRTLFEHLTESFKYYGLTVDLELFNALCKTGKILLVLDGFDEIEEEKKQSVIHEIEDMINIHDNMSIIISSRPNSGFQASPFLRVVKLLDLKNKEYEEIVDKISATPEYAESLKSSIRDNSAQISSLLCTPLMVTLLVMQFKAYQEIPKHLSEFYNSIFQILISRHDGVKPGFRRNRQCVLSDSEYRSIFEAFCYFSKSNKSITFEQKDLLVYAKKAFSEAGIKENSSNFIEDITKITNLILKESTEYRFIHKSVQEYYAAAFINSRPEKIVKSFYERIISMGLTARVWEQEIRFLSEIDAYSFNKFYFIPSLNKFFDVSNQNDLHTQEFSVAIFKKYFGNLFIVSASKDGLHSIYYSGTVVSMPPAVLDLFSPRLFGIRSQEIIKGIVKAKLNGISKEDMNTKYGIVPTRSDRLPFEGEIYYTLEYAYENGIEKKEILDSCGEAFKYIQKNYKTALNSISRFENEKLIDVLGA